MPFGALPNYLSSASAVESAGVGALDGKADKMLEKPIELVCPAWRLVLLATPPSLKLFKKRFQRFQSSETGAGRMPKARVKADSQSRIAALRGVPGQLNTSRHRWPSVATWPEKTFNPSTRPVDSEPPQATNE